MLILKNINKTIQGKKIVKDISFELDGGQICGLLGPNGAGKTTTFYVISGLTYQSSGEIYLDKNNISKLPIHKRSLRGLKYLPQEPSIFQDLTVLDNLYGVAEFSYRSKKNRDFAVNEIIEEFSLSEILNQSGRQLSGGQRRKVEIARTLLTKPSIILLDEPFAGIDPITVDEIKDILKKLSRKKIGILITDHNIRDTLEICDKAFIISNGEIIASGSKEELINNEMVKKVYFGKMFN